MEQIGDSIKQGQEARVRTIRHFKKITLGLLSAGVLVLNWWLIREAMFGGVPAGYWAWPVATTAVWTVLVSFFALINPDRWTFFTFNSIGLVAYLAIMPRDIYVFLGGVLFFLISLMFQARLQDEEKSQLNFSVRRTLGNSQQVMTYGLLALVGFLLFSTVNAEFRKDPDALYRRMASQVVQRLPFISSNGGMEGFNLKDYFVEQAQQRYPDFGQLPAERQEELIDFISGEFANQFGVNAQSNAALQAALVEVVTARFSEMMGSYERFFPLFFTILVIALLRTVMFVFNWVVILLSWLAFRVLLAARFFRLEKRTVEVEKLEI